MSNVAGLLCRCLILAVAVLVCAVPASAGKFNRKLSAGNPAPSWKDLKGVDGKTHSLDDLKEAKAIVVVFTCNHCPVAQSYERRFIEFSGKMEEKGVRLVAISCSRLPQDGFDKMKARAAEKKYNFPYLHDAEQQIARSYGATVTPHVFVLDGERKIAYMGAFDDSMDAGKVTRKYVQNAVESVLKGEMPEIRETLQFGCGIEY